MLTETGRKRKRRTEFPNNASDLAGKEREDNSPPLLSRKEGRQRSIAKRTVADKKSKTKIKKKGQRKREASENFGPKNVVWEEQSLQSLASERRHKGKNCNREEKEK